MALLSLESSLVVQWLGLGTFTAKSQGLIPSWGIKFMQAKKKSKPQVPNKFPQVDETKVTKHKVMVPTILRESKIIISCVMKNFKLTITERQNSPQRKFPSRSANCFVIYNLDSSKFLKFLSLSYYLELITHSLSFHT